MEEGTLIVGLDLGNEVSEICCYDNEIFEPVCLTEKAIPTVAGVKESGEWVFGEEAMSTWQAGRCTLLKNVIDKIAKGNPISVYGKEVRPVFLLALIFRKMLSLVHGYDQEETILKLVVTVEMPTKELTDNIYTALESLGIKKDRAVVVDYKQSYMYYVLSQKREIWVNDVGMFYFGNKGLKYSQFTIDRRKTPNIVGITERDYSGIINMDMFGKDMDRLVYEFENVAQNAIHKQIISTLYMIGNGFENGWADESMRKLCYGRRVFKGDKLYVKGACYGARYYAGKSNIEPFVYIDENMTTAHISARVYVGAGCQEIIVSKAGSVWYDVDSSFDIIPCEETELVMGITDIITKTSSKHIIALEDICTRRPDRMSRINVRVRMQAVDKMIVTIKDLGFGEIYPSTNRIYERVIDLSDIR